MSGDEEMMTAMGFTSFGRTRRERGRMKQVTNKKSDVLPQLMPGTEAVGKQARFSLGSVEDGSHGVVYLLCKDSVDDRSLLDVALDEKTESSVEHKGENLVSYSALLEELKLEKHKFEKLENAQFLRARAATNAFEALGRHRFLNRSAMKLVTLDHIFQWTQGLDQQESFSFADICGGPGGFSEYLLWRTKEFAHRVYGYGITLKKAANNCDWRLPSTSSDLFEICYGEDGTGNLYSVANIHNFSGVVRARYPGGVDLVVADGGFLDARSQSNQESMMTRLILAEVFAMFSVLRIGGDFVCKTFELATPPMLELCWVLHQCFDRFAVVKPITSRPASSERYIIARGLRMGYPTLKLADLLEHRLAQSNNCGMGEFQSNILHNSTPMRKDMDFLQYMAAVNEALTTSQIQACERINQYAVNQNKRKRCEAGTKIDTKEYYQCWQLGQIHHQ